MNEPMLRAWIQEPVRPKPFNEEKPGRWVAEESWPSPRIRPVSFRLAPGRLTKRGARSKELPLTIASPQTVGLAAGKWSPYGLDADQAGDQRDEAGGSLVFDTEPLDKPLEILGAPVLHLDVASDRPNAFVAATLSEVLPDGAATRLSYGILNLTHRDGHEELRPLEPGRRYTVKLKLNDCGERIGAGNRLRLAISTAYWPIVWPSPEPVTLTVMTGASSLELPVRPPRAKDRQLKPFEPAEHAPPLRRTVVRPAESRIEVKKDLRGGHTWVERYQDDGLLRIEDFDWEYRTAGHRIYSIEPDDPLSAEARIHWQKEYGRDGFRVHIDAKTHMTVTRADFLIRATLEAYEGDELVFSKEWDCRIPRDHV
jgi:hypothetical protein